MFLVGFSIRLKVQKVNLVSFIYLNYPMPPIRGKETRNLSSKDKSRDKYINKTKIDENKEIV